ncbi:unnamed protein product [Lampetra fluviatilis]
MATANVPQSGAICDPRGCRVSLALPGTVRLALLQLLQMQQLQKLQQQQRGHPSTGSPAGPRCAQLEKQKPRDAAARRKSAGLRGIPCRVTTRWVRYRVSSCRTGTAATGGALRMFEARAAFVVAARESLSMVGTTLRAGSSQANDLEPARGCAEP